VLVAILKHAQGLTIRLTANHLCSPSNAPSCRSDTDLRQRNTPEMTHAIITICSSGAVVSSRFFIAPLLSTRSLATYDAAFATSFATGSSCVRGSPANRACQRDALNRRAQWLHLGHLLIVLLRRLIEAVPLACVPTALSWLAMLRGEHST
jgi:hypothetical protein